MKLSPQKRYLYDLYKDGEWRCSTFIEYVRDFRKRISEMREDGFNFESTRCDGRCEKKHVANIHMYRLVESPKKKVWVHDLKDGVRVPRLTYQPL